MMRSALIPARITVGMRLIIPLNDPRKEPAMETNIVMVP